MVQVNPMYTHEKIKFAALNNALWCDAVCRAHGGDTMLTEHVWFNRVNSPPFYPNVDTLTKDGRAAQLGVIQSLMESPLSGGWGVKDSFCTLDLAPLGFRPLFEAQWIWRDPEPTLKNLLPDAGWTVIRTPAELARWEAGWRGPEGDPSLHIFVPTLLDTPDTFFLAARRAGEIVAGVVATRTGEVVGVSNLFTPPGEKADFWAGAVATVQQIFPGLPLVGYESGEDLEIVPSLGFEEIGPLRVWLRT